MFNERNVTYINRQALWEYYNTHLSQAFDVGYNVDSKFYDEELARSLKNNIAKFSAFKETSFKTQMEASLTENGKVVPWSEFKKKAAELNVEYNKRWLKTEYHHTVATANSVDKWKGFEADADLYPNLKYNAVNDARTREKHKALDGLILPINHPFWKTHNVPLDWGCRCNLEQTDEEVSKVIPELNIKDAFKNNAALSGEIFGEIPYANGMSKTQIKESEANAENFNTKKDYETLNKVDIFKENMQDLKNNIKEVYPKIDIEKINSVNMYSGTYYSEINKFNRGVLDAGGYFPEFGVTKEFYRALTRTINKALDEIPDKFIGDVYRGVELTRSQVEPYRKAFENGSVFIEKGFTSTSSNIKEAFDGNI